MSDQFCKFCKWEVSYCPLKEMEEHGVKIYFCVPCQAEYLFWKNTRSFSLYTTINDKMYRWSIMWGGSVAHLWYVKDPGIPGIKRNKNLELLKDFSKDDIPHITPQNVNSKIKAWLPFL